MKELETFGRFLLKELLIDRDPDWERVIHKYNTRWKRSKFYSLLHINSITAREFDLKPDVLFKKTKEHKITIPRNIAKHMMRLCGYSNREIAEFYNNDSYSTITSNIKSIMDLYDTNKYIKWKVNKLKKQIL